MKHYLVVSKFWDEDHSCWGYDWWIEHDKDCPKEQIKDPLDYWEEYRCMVGMIENWRGLEDLADDPKFNTEGKHKINAYNYFSTSFWEDSESYLYYENENPCTPDCCPSGGCLDGNDES